MDQHDTELLKSLTNTIKFTFLDKSIFDNNFKYVDKLCEIFKTNPCEKLIDKAFVMPNYKYEKDKISAYIKEFNIYDDKLIRKYIINKYGITNSYNTRKLDYIIFTPFFLQVCKLVLLLNYNLENNFNSIPWVYSSLLYNKKIDCPIIKEILSMKAPYNIPSQYNYITNVNKRYYRYNILAIKNMLHNYNNVCISLKYQNIDPTCSYIQLSYINKHIIENIGKTSCNIFDKFILLKEGCLNVAKYIIDSAHAKSSQNAILLLLQIGRYFHGLKYFMDNKNDLLAIFNMEYMKSKFSNEKINKVKFGNTLVIQYLNTMVNSNDIYIAYYKNRFSYTKELLYIALKNFQYDIVCDTVASGLQIKIKHIIYFYDNIINFNYKYNHYIKNKLEILESILFLLVNNTDYTIKNVLELISSSHFTIRKKFKSMFIRILSLKDNSNSIITYDLLKVAARKGLYFKNLEIPYDDILYNIYYPYYIPLYYLKRFPNKEEIINRSYGNYDKSWKYFNINYKKRNLITNYSGYCLQKMYENKLNEQNRILYNHIIKQITFIPVTNMLYDYEYLNKYYTIQTIYS